MTSKTLSRRPVSNLPNGALGLAWGKHSHQGPRAENQDAVIVVGPRDPQIARKGVLMIVCDGVGGAQGGRRASEIASNVAYQAFYADPSADPRVSIENAIRKANAAVKEEASMATTIVVTVVVGNSLFVGHVGDSRAYLFHADGRNERITRDHSWVHEQVERGVLTEQQAKENPMRSVITRSLGAASNNASEQRQFTLAPGDVLTTGTPPGVGMGRRDAAGQPAPVFLKAGDVMTLGIDGLGQQRQRVVAFRADAPATGR
jgi:protein phosphatase